MVVNTLGQTLAAEQQYYGREGYADEWRFHIKGGGGISLPRDTGRATTSFLSIRPVENRLAGGYLFRQASA